MTTTTTRYNDWEVSQRHAEVVDELISSSTPSLRKTELHRTIPGVQNARITTGFRAGVWMMPLKSVVGNIFSSVHDVNRTSLLIAAVGRTTRQADNAPELMQFGEAVRTAFASRRVMQMNGELYSRHDTGEYDVDDNIARKYDILQILLISRFREDR